MLNEVQLGRVDLNLLVLFDAVSRRLHVARAAAELGLSPSAVSHGLGRLRQLFSDPLFLRTPRGVVATDRAAQLAAPVAEVLSSVRGIVAGNTPFEASRSTRRFVLGMPDATAAVLIPALMAETRGSAPGIDIGLRHILPDSAVTELEARRIDLAVVAVLDLPARFDSRPVCQEDFVIAARVGHPFLTAPTLKNYRNAQHILVSTSGDSRGFVDEALASRGFERRVTLTVSSFMLALAALGETDLLAALPRSLALAHAARFGVGHVEAPLELPSGALKAVALRAALLDAGIDWLVGAVQRAALAGAEGVRPKRTGAARRPTERRRGKGAR